MALNQQISVKCVYIVAVKSRQHSFHIKMVAKKTSIFDLKTNKNTVVCHRNCSNLTLQCIFVLRFDVSIVHWEWTPFWYRYCRQSNAICNVAIIVVFYKRILTTAHSVYFKVELVCISLFFLWDEYIFFCGSNEFFKRYRYNHNYEGFCIQRRLQKMKKFLKQHKAYDRVVPIKNECNATLNKAKLNKLVVFFYCTVYAHQVSHGNKTQ